MSVLKTKRNLSKAEYVNTARKIKVETRAFLSRLSARYARLDAPDIMHLAREVADLTEQANSMMPTDETRYNIRLGYLLKARATLAALDADLLDVYDTLMMNPEGAFSTQKGASVSAGEAIQRLDYMAENLGCLIADEENLLTALMKSDKQFLKKKLKEKESSNKTADEADGAKVSKYAKRYMKAIGSGAISKEAIPLELFEKIMSEHDEREAVRILMQMSKASK